MRLNLVFIGKSIPCARLYNELEAKHSKYYSFSTNELNAINVEEGMFIHVAVLIADEPWMLEPETIEGIRDKVGQETFLVVSGYDESLDLKARQTLVGERCRVNMITPDRGPAMDKALTQVFKMYRKERGRPTFPCPLCPLQNLSESALWLHVSLYHTAAPNLHLPHCPICDCDLKHHSFQKHLHNHHNPRLSARLYEDDRRCTTMYAFALVVVHREQDNKFLLVHEKNARGFWLPGGSIDNPSEPLQCAASRETVEEAGVDIDIQGILRVEYTPSYNGVRLRVIFYAHPVDPLQEPKSLPDYESFGASYVSLQEIKELDNVFMRGPEPLYWISYVLDKKLICPLSFLTTEHYGHHK